MSKKRIAVVTGSRAEYGILYWLMREIHSDPDLELITIATGMHLSPTFGYTAQEIEEDGFTIHWKVDSLLSGDNAVSVSKSVGLGVIGFADAYAHLKPHCVILLGDRFESLAAAQAAMLARIPIAHIHGGELSFGALDEHIRHAITKMSRLHFVAAEPYQKRVIQLGESPERVFNVGAPGLDHIQKTPLLSRSELEEKFNFKFGEKNFLVTYHPTTEKIDDVQKCAYECLDALDHFTDAKIIFTKSNADEGGQAISNIFETYASKQPERCTFFISLGSKNYLSFLNKVDVMIGNSSSGIIEAPLFKKPCVNIGSRQDGRLKAKNVIDCQSNADAIKAAIQKALTMYQNNQNDNIQSLYGSGDASKKIKDILKKIDLKSLTHKTFYDISFESK